MTDESSQHSVDSTSSSRKRYRASPEDLHAFAEPSKDVSSRTQKLGKKISASKDENHNDDNRSGSVFPTYQQWIQEQFASVQYIEEVSLKARYDGEGFRCFKVSQFDKTSPPVFVRHAKIHRSVLGWVESCSAAEVDSQDGYLIPSTFIGHERIALKIFDLRKVYSMPSRENALNELRIHAKLSHIPNVNVSHLLAYFRTSDLLIAVFPMYERGDLFEYLAQLEASHRRLSEPDMKQLMLGAINAIDGCHQRGICHRDISLENFCLRFSEAKGKIEPVLIDFGVASEMELGSGLTLNTGPVGKAKYMAPELLNSAKEMPFYDGRKCDVFSLGVMLLIMAIQREPWDSTQASDRCFNRMILHGELDLVLRIWGIPISKALLDLLKAMLNSNPNERPSLDEVKAHPWFGAV